MNPQRYTEVSMQASERYQAVLTTFRGMLFAAMREPFSTRRADDLRKNAVEVGRMFMRSETVLVDEELTRTALETVQTVEDQLAVRRSGSVPDALSAFLTQNVDYLDSELRTQLSRDVEMLVRRYREAALEAKLMGTQGVLGADRTMFQFRDRAGRILASQRFIRLTWRQVLVTVGAEFFALEAAARGVSEIEVEASNSRWDGLKIAISDASSAQPFGEVRDEVFQPQSQVTLKVSDVRP